MSNSWRPHGLQHTRLPCPSPTPRACSNSCPSSWWWHPTISSSVIPFSSCLQSFPAPGSFPVNQFFASGGQSIGVSASASVLPMNIQDWFLLGWTAWISFHSKGLSKSLFQHHSSKASIFNENRFQQKPCGSYRILIVASWLIYSGIAWCGGLVAKSKLVASLLLFPWDFPGKNTGVGYHFLQGIFPTQGLKAGLLHCRQILYQLSYQGIPPNQWTCTKL